LINQNVGRIDLSRMSGGKLLHTRSFTVQAIGMFTSKTPSNVATFNITLTD
jgi:hypothetical protein